MQSTLICAQLHNIQRADVTSLRLVCRGHASLQQQSKVATFYFQFG